MRRPVRLVCGVLAMGYVAANVGQAQGLGEQYDGWPIGYQGETIGTLRSMEIASTPGSAYGFSLRLTLEFASFTNRLDQLLSDNLERVFGTNRGDLSVGDTVIRQAGSSLRLSTRIRVFEVAQTLTWRLYVPATRVDALRIHGEVENPQGVIEDEDLGRAIRAATFDVGISITIPSSADCGFWSCAQLVDRLALEVDAVSFSHDGRGTVGLTVTSSGDLTDLLGRRE